MGEVTAMVTDKSVSCKNKVVDFLDNLQVEKRQKLIEVVPTFRQTRTEKYKQRFTNDWQTNSRKRKHKTDTSWIRSPNFHIVYFGKSQNNLSKETGKVTAVVSGKRVSDDDPEDFDVSK